MRFPRLAPAASPILLVALAAPALAADAPAPAPKRASYYGQVRPIFQAHCQGCHQPAKAGGGYVMTSFDRLLAGGEAEGVAIVPGKVDEGHLLGQVTPGADGKAEMPKGRPPLSAADRETVARWIAEGAVDDSPAATKARFDRDHPPTYRRPPAVGALDYSPDGRWLAVGGSHEVLLWAADGSELAARLVGLSERIESVRFSPDGSKLAASGGLPGRMGEVQVWDVARRELLLSAAATTDTLFGLGWSPDGSKIAFGCGDNGVRAVDATTGAAVLFMGSHSDWALDAAFTVDGSHVVSAGRDMAAKLTELATQRFVDNITSITPGALKGGLAAVARHPGRDEVVLGGADGVPRLYRVFRQTDRVIGDDSNLIREFDPIAGRVNAVAVSRDGRRIASGGGIDGLGEVAVDSYEFDTALPEPIKAIMRKVSYSRSPQEVEALRAYTKAGVRRVSKASVPGSPVYAVAFSADGATLAAAGLDGRVRLIDPGTGRVAREFVPVPVEAGSAADEAPGPRVAPRTEEAAEAEPAPTGGRVVSLAIDPPTPALVGRNSYVQVTITATLDTGEAVDATRMASVTIDPPLADWSTSGLVRPAADGSGTLVASVGGVEARAPIVASKLGDRPPADFVRDVNPVLSRLGCNQGTCHGSAQGKNGFKLSLRGYDPVFDVRALADEQSSRRVDPASPDESLMLLKPTGAVPHAGGALLNPGEPYHAIIRRWIADGAGLDASTPKVAKIELSPTNPVIREVGRRQQLRVLATYADGLVRDVTREAFIESGNGDVATANRSGLMTSLRRGEAPILARFEGAYAATTLTVMGDRSGFAAAATPSWGRIDDLVAAKWARLKIRPSGLCDDAEFLRRASIDLTGLPPTSAEVRAFLADGRETRIKRDEVIDRLIGGKDYVEYWTNKWADLLQVNRKFLGVEGAVGFRAWIRDQVARNVPYDKFVREILTAGGSNRAHPAASYFKILREPAATMENTTQLFLGVRFNCNKCHDHPFERWTQDQYYETAAYFARVGLKADPASAGRTVGGTNVEAPTPLFEEVVDLPAGEVTHDRTKKVAAPRFPYGAPPRPASPGASRRAELADWVASPGNAYFARSYVNRLWGYLLGVGIIEPLDDIRAGNPATNPELLDDLTAEFVKGGFDTREVVRRICKSRTYQLSVATDRWNEDDKTNYSHAIARRLPAEVLYDAVRRVTGSASKIPGVPDGTRAAELPDSGVELPSGFLATFGRPVRESACECERSSGLQLGPVMALVSGPTISEAIDDPSSALAGLVRAQADDRALIEEVFLRVLNRPATPAEVDAGLGSIREVDADHRRLAESLGRLEAEVAIARPDVDRAREAALRAAEADLAAYEPESRATQAAAVAAQNARIAAVEAEVEAAKAALPAKVAAWEKAQSTAVRWVPLAPREMKSTGAETFAAGPDGSIVVSGAPTNGVLTITADTDLAGITGVRLEAIADPALPNKGPGRAPDGNFVLTEFELAAAPRSNPADARAVKLQNAASSFDQATFGAAQAIDGDKASDRYGWALSPATGVTHWATFEAAEPVGAAGGSTLTIRLHHRFNGGPIVYEIGRFRVSVTRLPRPIGLGLAEDYRAILATDPAIRSAAQNQALLDFQRAVDPALTAKLGDLAVARTPPPADARLADLKARVETAKQPAPTDPRLAQLRKDVEMSIRQAGDRRLTAAQDVVWALINSPSFLFNH